MKNKTLWIVLGVVAVVVVWAIVSYNGLVTKQEKVSEAWANVETVYQRRADLIPNLVEGLCCSRGADLDGSDRGTC